MDRQRHYLKAIHFILVLLLCVTRAWSAGVHLNSFEKNGLYGFKDATGVVVIPARYQHVEEFTSCGIAPVWNPSGWVFVDTQGATLEGITPYVFDSGADYFKEGLARFQNRRKIGYIDSCGHIRIPAQFDGAFPFSKGRADVCQGCISRPDGEHSSWQGGRWATIDVQGKVVVPFH